MKVKDLAKKEGNKGRDGSLPYSGGKLVTGRKPKDLVEVAGIKCIYIEWCDAIADSSRWMGLDEAKEWANNEDWVVKQVCFLLDETKEYLLLASRINPHKDTEHEIRVDGVLKLPKTWVRNRIDLSTVIHVS